MVSESEKDSPLALDQLERLYSWLFTEKLFSDDLNVNELFRLIGACRSAVANQPAFDRKDSYFESNKVYSDYSLMSHMHLHNILSLC